MLSNLLTVTGQVATLFLMMAVGLVLGRAGKITEAGRSQMSYLLLYIVCPCVMVDCFLVKRTPALTQEVAVGSAAALACYLLFFAVSLLFFRRQPADARDTLRFAAVYGNIGFMGLPLVQSILGEEALVYGALGLWSDGGELRLTPRLPPEIRGASLCVYHRGRRLRLTVRDGERRIEQEG